MRYTLTPICIAFITFTPLFGALDDFEKSHQSLSLDTYKQRKLKRFNPQTQPEFFSCVEAAQSVKSVKQCIQKERTRRIALMEQTP